MLERPSTGFDIAVVGGSLGGLNAALWLRDLNFNVSVFERSPVPLSGLGAGLVLHPSTVRYLTQRLGIALEDIAVPSDRVRYIGSDGEVISDVQSNYLFSSYDALYREFHQAFGEESYFLGNNVASIKSIADRPRLCFSDGKERSFDLVVCADGVTSSARAKLVPKMQKQYAGYVAWRGTVDSQDVGSENFEMLRHSISYHVMKSGHMLTYPIPMWDESTAKQKIGINWLLYVNVPSGYPLDQLMTDRQGMIRDVSVPAGAVREENLSWLRKDVSSPLPRILASCVNATREPFIQRIQDVKTDRMVFGKVCLMGDAAFVVRPHIAIGTAKAAEDGWRLAHEIHGAKDWASALRRWEARQVALGKSVLARSREAGDKVQFRGAWSPGEPLPYGLHRAGDSDMSLGRELNNAISGKGMSPGV